MLSEAVAGAAHSFGDRPAVLVNGSGLTWAQVHLASEALAPVLAARGVRPGAKVGLALRTGPAWLVAATAVDRAGGAFAGISPVATPAERATMVETLDPTLVLAGSDMLEGLPLRAEVAVLSRDGLGLDGDPAGDRAAPPVRAHDRSDDRRFAVCFTSGTTGSPKAAEFAVRQARAVRRIDLGEAAEKSTGGGMPMIASTQFAHVGFVLKAPWYAQLGCTLHVMERWRADDAIDLLERHGMPTLGVVAPQLALILRSARLADADLTALRLVIAGGAPSPPGLVLEARERLGVDYSVRWSSTESGGVGLAALVDDDQPEAIGSIGLPRPGIRVRIAAPDGTPVPRGEVGELQILSPATMTGYLGAPEATEAAIATGGWLHTGDMARVRDDDRIVLAGRATDMYIRGGYNVHPDEVEAALGSHPCVGEVAVAPRPDEVMGEIGVAVVVTASGAQPPTLEDLRRHASDRLARHKLPEAVVLVDRLPLTGAAKLDRRCLAEMVRT